MSIEPGILKLTLSLFCGFALSLGPAWLYQYRRKQFYWFDITGPIIAYMGLVLVHFFHLAPKTLANIAEFIYILPVVVIFIYYLSVFVAPRLFGDGFSVRILTLIVLFVSGFSVGMLTPTLPE